MALCINFLIFYLCLLYCDFYVYISKTKRTLTFDNGHDTHYVNAFGSLFVSVMNLGRFHVLNDITV